MDRSIKLALSDKLSESILSVFRHFLADFTTPGRATPLISGANKNKPFQALDKGTRTGRTEREVIQHPLRGPFPGPVSGQLQVIDGQL